MEATGLAVEYEWSRDVAVGLDDGFIYVIAYDRASPLLRLEPTGVGATQ